MSQDKMDHQQDPKCASRRSRKDEQGRDYVCGCGKRYLSYPALYTHIKTKHDGHQPEGTQKTGGIQPVSSRRPKQKLDDRILKDILNLIPIQSLKILTQLDQNAHGCIAVCNRIKKQHLGREIVQAYHIITKLNSLNLDKKSSLEMVLVCYLLGAGQYTCQAMFLYYMHFARLFRNCFHDYGQQIYENTFKNKDPRKNKSLNLQQCKMAPIICDFFIRYYLQQYENKDPDFQSVMELICCDFCQWMYTNKLTIVQTSMMANYEISRRNLIEPKSKKNEEQNLDQDDDRQDKEESEENHSSINESGGERKGQVKQNINADKSNDNKRIETQKALNLQL